MGYYDGNAVTGLWNLAQHFSLSDAFFGTTFGPSTPGALNLIAGQTHGSAPANASYSSGQPYVANGSITNDPDPTGDDCSSGGTASHIDPEPARCPTRCPPVAPASSVVITLR